MANDIQWNGDFYERLVERALERDDDERLAPLSNSGYVLVYKKEYYNNIGGYKLVRLLIIDVRRIIK